MPELDHDALQRACFSLAQKAQCDRRPVDVGTIDDLTIRLAQIAASHATYLEGMKRDPNFVVRAVAYIERHHGLAWGDRTEWFNNFVELLVELACPRRAPDEASSDFYLEIERGFAASRNRAMAPRQEKVG